MGSLLFRSSTSLRRLEDVVLDNLFDTAGALIREDVRSGLESIAAIEGGVISFVRADHIGRPVFATNSSGVKVWTATYHPFGGVHVSTGTLPPNRFPGQWFQSESGLHQNWMRDYDPTTGRYLQADPLGLIDGASVYGYVKQSPLRYTDPTGEAIPALALGVAVGGLVMGYLLGELADFVECKLDCEPLPSPDFLSALAGASAADGSAAAYPKPRTSLGAANSRVSGGSSIQSTVLSRLFPGKIGKPVYTPSAKRWPWPKSNTYGRVAGRWLPLVGYGYAGYDFFRIARCVYIWK